MYNKLAETNKPRDSVFDVFCFYFICKTSVDHYFLYTYICFYTSAEYVVNLINFILPGP